MSRPASLKWVVVAALVGNMLVQMLLAAAKDTPTFDEPFHVGAGMEKYHRDLQWGADHPPVAQLLAALPLQFVKFDTPAHPKEQIDSDGYVRGRDYLYQGDDPDGHAAHVIWLARLPIMAATVATMLVLFFFAKDLFGFWGAVLALTLGSANPSMLAHGRLVTTDMVLTGLILTAIWLIWRSKSSPRQQLLLVGAAGVYGLALATKFTALFMLPFTGVLVMWAVYRNSAAGEKGGPAKYGDEPADSAKPQLKTPVKAVLAAVVFAAVGVAAAWAVYLAVDPSLEYRTRVTAAPEGVSEKLATLLPMPSAFKDGLRLQIGWDKGSRIGYLLGEKYFGGKVSFYPAVIAMKTPLALLIGFAVGVFAWFKAPRPVEELVMLLLVPFSFLLFSMTTGTNLGVRHVLIVPLFMALVCGAIVTLAMPWARITGLLLGLWALASTWASFPSHLAYINEAFGGSNNAYKVVGDSNVDWGQDLGRLRDYLQTHEVTEPIWLAYFGQIPIEAYGMPVKIADPEKPEEVSGTFAVSVTKLNGQIPGPYDKLVEDRRPFAQIGHSILLYDLGPGAGTPDN